MRRLSIGTELAETFGGLRDGDRGALICWWGPCEELAQFPTPSPSLASLESAKDALLTAIGNALDGGRSAHQAKRDKFRTLKNLLKQIADYVANVANGDAQLIIDGGYELRAEATPSHLPGAPSNLDALTPDVTNAVKIEWKGERNVRLYQVQMSATDPAGTPAWTTVALTSKRQHTVSDLEPYRVYWFRVIAVNVAGESLPSDVLMARAA